ncbi:MAG: hypothetical protein ABR586_04190 [Thermoplasmatota archaeon]
MSELRDNYVLKMTLAYGSVASTSAQNWSLWHSQMGEVAAGLEDLYREAGWTAPPAVWDAFWARVDVPLPLSGADAIQHVRLVRGLFTDYGARLMEHVSYRLGNEGNVHLSVSGPTGMGKSSAAIGLIDDVKRIQRGELLKHVCIDMGKLPAMLRGIQAGEFILMDEYLQLAGEGSRTLQMMWENIEDTIRASGKSIIVCSPQMHDFRTMQLHLELVLWNPAAKASLFLVWIQGQIHGVLARRWMDADLYAEYKPWKDGNVARTESGQFKEASQTARQCMVAFQNERVTQYLLGITGRPKKSDFEDVFAYFPSAMMPGTEAKRLASFAWKHCANWTKREPSFRSLFGVEPVPGFLAVAAKYSQESRGKAVTSAGR